MEPDAPGKVVPAAALDLLQPPTEGTVTCVSGGPALLPLRILGRLRAVLLSLALSLSGTPEALAQAKRPTEPTAVQSAEDRAKEELATAMLYYEQADYLRATLRFGELLQSPQRLRTRSELHEAFLHAGYAAFLADEFEQASEFLRTAVRLDLEFLPSPVTTQPDLLAFYGEVRAAWVEENGDSAERLGAIFPELANLDRRRPRRFVPFFTIGLRYYGHHKEADALLATQMISLGLNALSVGLRLGALYDGSREGFQITDTGRVLGYTTAPAVWLSFSIDFVRSIELAAKNGDIGRGRKEQRAASRHSAPARRPLVGER